MKTNRLAKQLFGIVVLLVGCVLLLASLGRLPYIAHFWAAGNLGLILWNVAGLVLFPSLGVYCVCAGLRLLNPQLIKKPRFGWGRIVIGSFMLYVQVGSDLHFIPDGPVPTLKPSNPTQATSMRMTGGRVAPGPHLRDLSGDPCWVYEA
jgi:hypothetical protein